MKVTLQNPVVYGKMFIGIVNKEYYNIDLQNMEEVQDFLSKLEFLENELESELNAYKNLKQMLNSYLTK